MRRSLLIAIVAVVSLVIALILIPHSCPTRFSSPPPKVSTVNSTTTPIKYVIIIILENHSFDNIYGVYPFGTPPIINNITLSLMRPLGLGAYLGEVSYANSVMLEDPWEGYRNYHVDWNFGAMNGFINGSGSRSMVYLSYEQVPLLWDYAEEYVLADNYFSPDLATTMPNRISYLVGYPVPMFGASGCRVSFNQTILYQLTEYNISWAYFDYGYRQDQPLPPYPLSLIPGSSRYSNHYFNTSVFLEDLRDGNLPSISFLMFTGGDGHDDHSALDLHPPFNLTQGQVNLAYFIDAIEDSPYWNSTVIFITFDEGGGFFDQVPPPIIYNYGLNPGCEDGYLSKLGLPYYNVLGERVPLLIISPYAKESWIDNYSLSGYTLLAFIDYNWHLPYLTPIVANSDLNGLLMAFNFSQTPRPPIILTPLNWTYPIPLQYPVHYGYVALIKGNYTGYTLLYRLGIINDTVYQYVMQFNDTNT
ncbi:MAG: alkaline phosphatase family protein [Vulcanisaeta sp.]|uniref:alkaline phosphatase family protein n=1 Tax=Vulcanisaeta sp. TaxID=2020871 RepID=UPI003D126A48